MLPVKLCIHNTVWLCLALDTELRYVIFQCCPSQDLSLLLHGKKIILSKDSRDGHLCTSRTHLSFAIITVFLPTFDFVNSINYNHLAHIYVL